MEDDPAISDSWGLKISPHPGYIAGNDSEQVFRRIDLVFYHRLKQGSTGINETVHYSHGGGYSEITRPGMDGMIFSFDQCNPQIGDFPSFDPLFQSSCYTAFHLILVFLLYIINGYGAVVYHPASPFIGFHPKLHDRPAGLRHPVLNKSFITTGWRFLIDYSRVFKSCI